jgi:hypothetical protein
MVAAARLSAVERRRRAAERPPEPPHAIELRPLAGTGAAALIVGAKDLEFLPALVDDLGRDDWRARLAARLAHRRGTDGVAELSPPLHRRFQLVLLEAVCRMPGFPRVDPAKLVGMGMVIRRESARGPLGWIGASGPGRGWLPLAGGLDLDPDPEPPQAEDRARAARALDRLLAERRGAPRLAEQVAPLHLAPPEVCAARGKTILFGVLPLASAETTRGGGELQNLTAAEETALTAHFSYYLKRAGVRGLPRGGEVLSPAWAPLESGDTAGEAGRLLVLAQFLRQLVVEFDVLGTGAAARALAGRLEALRVVTVRAAAGRPAVTISALAFVRQAAPVLLARAPNAGGHRMPLDWPAISEAAERDLLALARACLVERFAAVAPEIPKFDDDRARYRVRAFVRAAGHPHCSPTLVWSAPSEPFRIRPWWDSDAPPLRLSLPDIEQARAVRPGVAFAMPPRIARLLQGDMKKLKDGDDPGGPAFELGWLCSFSIPIITLCAFIVLNIFLTLFNLIFQWLLWIRVCLPIPKRSGDG